MGNGILLSNTQEDSSAAVTMQKIYSAKELAEIFMKSRPDFLGMDMELVTMGWNSDFIYEFLYHVNEKSAIRLALEWLESAWLTKHHCYETYGLSINPVFVKKKQEFHEMLVSIKTTLDKRLEYERRQQELLKKMLEGYNDNKDVTEESDQEIAKGEVVLTKEPDYKAKSTPTTLESGTSYKMLISDLPKDLQNKIVVSQNIFDVYVKQLNEDAWTIVKTNKSRYSDPLRFLSNFHGITSRDTSREEFDSLLHYIVKDINGKPSLLSSMGRCSLTTDKKISRSYLCYANADVSPEMKEEIWQLVNDCEPLEESLQPVIDAIKAEENKQSQCAQLGIQP